MHIIELKIALGFIEVTVDGCWSEDHVDTFAADLRAAIAGFPPTASGKPPMTLYNYTHAQIQPQAVVARMRALAEHTAMRDRTVAMYTDGVLARQQARRVVQGRDHMRVFDCRADALAFLRSHRVNVAARAPSSIDDRTAQRPVGNLGSSGALSA